jgi:hypothetical protein
LGNTVLQEFTVNDEKPDVGDEREETRCGGKDLVEIACSRGCFVLEKMKGLFCVTEQLLERQIADVQLRCHVGSRCEGTRTPLTHRKLKKLTSSVNNGA